MISCSFNSASRKGSVYVSQLEFMAVGVLTHGVSHSSSETWSSGMVRVLLARMLLMFVKVRRSVMPAKLTPVPSRLTWARCMRFNNFRPVGNRRWAYNRAELCWDQYVCRSASPLSVMRVRLRLSLTSWVQRSKPLLTTVSPTWVQANPNTYKTEWSWMKCTLFSG